MVLTSACLSICWNTSNMFGIVIALSDAQRWSPNLKYHLGPFEGGSSHMRKINDYHPDAAAASANTIWQQNCVKQITLKFSLRP